MPPQNNRREPAPPPGMTWSKAAPILTFAAIADVARAFFNFFWFFGPAFAGIFCAAYISGTTVGSLLSTQITSALCAGGVAVAGAAGFAPMAAFGVLMADSIGFGSFLILSGWVMAKNKRLLTTNASALLQLTGALLVAEIPFIGALPSYFFTLRRLYKHQIKVEKAARKKYEAEERARVQQQQLLVAQQQSAQRIEAQAAQEAAVAAASLEQEATPQIEGGEGATQEAQDKPKRSDELQAGARGSAEQEGTQSQAVSRVGRIGLASWDMEEFATLKDALSELNGKMNRTPEENRRLLRAKEIMRRVSITSTETRDPVLFAAYERARQGQKVFDGTPETRGGFVFSPITVTGGGSSSRREGASDEIHEDTQKAA